MRQVNAHASSATDLNAIRISLGPTGSLQLMFAALQLKLSEHAKTQAMHRMKQIETAQAEQKTVAGLLNFARVEQASAPKKENGKSRAMVATVGGGENNPRILKMRELEEYMHKHKLPFMPGCKEDWDVTIQALQSRMDQLGSNTQQLMVFIQDFMGQYNSYLQGANKQISDSNQTLLSLARGQ